MWSLSSLNLLPFSLKPLPLVLFLNFILKLVTDMLPEEVLWYHISAVTTLGAPLRLQNTGKSEAQTWRGKTHLYMAKNAADFSTVVCFSIVIAKALICYCICRREKLKKCKNHSFLHMLNFGPTISQGYVLSMPAQGQFPPYLIWTVCLTA